MSRHRSRGPAAASVCRKKLRAGAREAALKYSVKVLLRYGAARRSKPALAYVAYAFPEEAALHAHNVLP